MIYVLRWKVQNVPRGKTRYNIHDVLPIFLHGTSLSARSECAERVLTPYAAFQRWKQFNRCALTSGLNVVALNLISCISK